MAGRNKSFRSARLSSRYGEARQREVSDTTRKRRLEAEQESVKQERETAERLAWIVGWRWSERQRRGETRHVGTPKGPATKGGYREQDAGGATDGRGRREMEKQRGWEEKKKRKKGSARKNWARSNPVQELFGEGIRRKGERRRKRPREERLGWWSAADGIRYVGW